MNDPYYIKTQEKVYNITKDETFVGYESEIVENPTGTLVEKTITENGEYLPSEDNADGYSKVTVEVPIKTLVEKTITENGEYLPASDNADGYSKITVNVQGDNKLAKLVDGSLTEISSDDLSGITNIRKYAFYSYKNLTKITIPNGVLTIGQYAFEFCSGLLDITIGSGVTSIEANSFTMCNNLQSMTIYATNPPILGSNAMNDTNNCPIYVPAESVEAYKAATNWASLASRIFAIQE